MNRLQKSKNKLAQCLKKHFSLQNALIFALGVLLLSFVLVMVWDCAEKCISKLLGLCEKSEVLKFIGIGMGGILLALQALMSYKRAKALEDTAQAQADAAQAQADNAQAQANAANAQAKATEEQAKANQHVEQGQRQERMKNAIEHLGHRSDSVRLGRAYELFHLAQDTEELRQSVLDILCAHIRRTTGEDEYREKHKSKPSEEIQSLLTLLFVQEHEIFNGIDVNLQGSWLNGAELSRADLRWADLTRAHLQGANFSEACLHQAFLFNAQMPGAYLVRAHLYGTCFYNVQLQGANLGKARLCGANFLEAQLQGVNLAFAQLQGAILGDAQLQGAHLNGTQICGVRSEEDISDSFAQRMRQSIGQESDLSWVIFAGGLSQDNVDSLVKDLPNEEAKSLREKLEPHIDKPISYELPENSGAITGTYTEEEAEQWITEFESALLGPNGDTGDEQ